MPRFVILEHDYPSVHWDLMLESGEALRTWRLAVVPREGVEIEATALGEHRRMYLEYEGEVSGGRGRVRRWDWGEFDWVADSPDSVEVALRGQRVSGRGHLRRGDSGTWTFALISGESASAESAI